MKRQLTGQEKLIPLPDLREMSGLDSIADHNPKYLLTMDNDPPASYNGIRQMYVLDWLLGK